MGLGIYLIGIPARSKPFLTASASLEEKISTEISGKTPAPE
jgi:hypothetical protein